MLNTLLCGALLPALLLMRWVYRMDTVEKEPKNLLIKLVVWGALCCIPAALLEGFAEGLISSMDQDGLRYSFILAFGIVALSEEGCKFLALRRLTWDHPEFNYRFDGIVYAVFVSLGFAALENVQYVLNYGPSVIVSRGLLSVPGHAIFGVHMGLFYSNARYADLYNNGVGHRRNMTAALLVPVVLHGFFDFCLFTKNEFFILLFLGFVVVLDIISVRLVRRQSAQDRPF